MTQDRTRPDWRLGRRTFLKATGALGAALALQGGTLLDPFVTPVAAAESGEEIRRGICDMCCIGYCGIEALVKDGRITRVQPWADYPYGPLCSKGNSILQQVYNPERLKYPMKRTKPKGSDDAGWQRITWDEALDTIAAKFKEIKAKYGAEKVVFFVGDPKEEPRPPMQRLALKFGSPNYGTESSTCARAMQMAATLNGGGGLPITAATKTIVLWPKNPPWSMARDTWQIIEAKERGVKLIVVDPRLTQMAQMADIHLRLRPGTDGALALGMARVIINEGLYDADFVSKWVTGFEEFKAYVQEFTPEKVQEITWVPADKMVAAARLYATNKPVSWVTTASPTVHHANGVQNQRAIGALIGVTGNVDVPGLKPSVPGVSVKDLTEWRQLLPPLQEKRVDLKRFPVWAELVEEIQMNLLPEYVANGELKAGLFAGANFRMWPQDQEYRKAFSSLEFAAGADFWLTPTMQLMDIVLPAATSLERYGPIRIAGRKVFLPEPVVPAVGEARGDREWIFDLAKRLGLGADFWDGNVEASFDWQLEPLKLKAAELKKQPKGVDIPAGAPTPASNNPGFSTPSRKFELTSGILQKHDVNPLPVYKEPVESPVSTPDLAKKYPLVLNTGSREPMYVHSRHRNNPRLRELEPDPKVDINPKDAAARGIKQGDDVILEGPRGSVKAKANLTELAMPGVVHIYHGWPQADINTVTGRNFDPISGFPSFKSELCEVRKA